ALKDKRIKLVNQKNVGLTKSLNRGIKLARGKYIARQDVDDISKPDRFKKQMSFLTSHREVVLCGTWFLEVNEGTGSKVREYPVLDDELRKNIQYVNYFCHPSVIFLKQAFIEAGCYDESFTTAQDFELWIRMARTGKIANLPEVLVEKRIGFTSSVSWQKRMEKTQVVKDVISKHFKSWHDINFIKFFRYYLPLIVYGYIPVPLLKIIRKIRYT
ncbi:MAG: glycosyltransferase, partial [Bacteroidales bacterium]|nr:glycosyltransferase [Bacteroidales bacterium]